ncbi:MAG: phosphate-starvation-inducible PsiE family protein [Calothrix sp. FI2-JRJ7]|nr:phosphate-starvation-inducible PsiE family protein [Calothrix sp. FI2-JRJ7]
MIKFFQGLSKNETFLKLTVNFKSIITKILSLIMVLIIIFAVIDLVIFIIYDLIYHPIGRFSLTLLEILALFLNMLIGLEILKNITAYLKQQNIQLKLVITTSLMAVSRKIIVYDLEKLSGINLIGLAMTIFALSASYSIIKQIGNGYNRCNG